MAASLTVGSLLPARAKEETNQSPSYEQLAKDYKIKSEKISSNGKLVDVEHTCKSRLA
ncbi:hypothetical protein P9654_05740 [Bacillus atrophaeus]|nr:hypothetical protein [Bacillus atrophaeus]